MWMIYDIISINITVPPLRCLHYSPQLSHQRICVAWTLAVMAGHQPSAGTWRFFMVLRPLKSVFISHFPGMEDSCPGQWWIENLHAVHWKVWKNLHDGGWVRDGLHAFRHRCARLTDLMQARTGYKNGTRKKGAFDCSHVDGDGEREREIAVMWQQGARVFLLAFHIIGKDGKGLYSLLVECSWALASLHSSIRLKLLEPSRIGTPRYLSCRAALTQASNPSDTAQRGGVSYGAQRGGIPGIPGIDFELSSTLA